MSLINTAPGMALATAPRGADRRPREAPGEDPEGALARAEGGARRGARLMALDAAAIHARLREQFGDAIGVLEGAGTNACAVVDPARIAEVGAFCRDDEALRFD